MKLVLTRVIRRSIVYTIDLSSCISCEKVPVTCLERSERISGSIEPEF
jgi:hypothetical protein